MTVVSLFQDSIFKADVSCQIMFFLQSTSTSTSLGVVVVISDIHKRLVKILSYYGVFTASDFRGLAREHLPCKTLSYLGSCKQIHKT